MKISAVARSSFNTYVTTIYCTRAATNILRPLIDTSYSPTGFRELYSWYIVYSILESSFHTLFTPVILCSSVCYAPDMDSFVYPIIHPFILIRRGIIFTQRRTTGNSKQSSWGLHVLMMSCEHTVSHGGNAYLSTNRCAVGCNLQWENPWGCSQYWFGPSVDTPVHKQSADQRGTLS